jgi:hypothetical protein
MAHALALSPKPALKQQHTALALASGGWSRMIRPNRNPAKVKTLI